MRYKDISDIDLVDEGWADNIKKTAIAGATALGIGTAGADIASHFIQPADASINHSYNTATQNFLDRMEKDRHGKQQQPNGIHQNYPKELLGKEGEELKKSFVDHVSPIIKKENENILKDRSRLTKIVQKVSAGKELTREEREWAEELHVRYKMDGWNPKELLKRVDIVPVAIAVSQAALESGWGTSRFAKEANALFGQKTTSKDSIDSQTDRYARFNDFRDSIESYMRNLNSHKAYDEFRSQRAQMRQSDKGFDTKGLINTLLKYSTRGKEYVKHVKQIMSSNGLDKLS